MNTEVNWDAAEFFRTLTESNVLAQQKEFKFCRCLGMQGLQDLIEKSQSSTAFVCVNDISEGYVELNNSPKTRRIKTVVLAMRYPINNLAQRDVCMQTLREVFRQFMSKLILEETHLQERHLYLDHRIRFVELPEYFATGCACAKFDIAVDLFTDLRFNESEWITPTPSL